MKTSRTTLRQLHIAYTNPQTKEQPFHYKSLLTHVKKHQFLSQADFTKRHLNQIANQAEHEIIKREIKSKDVWNTVINEGMAGIESGEQKVQVRDMLKAAKDKSDWEMKQKDQQLAMMEMVFHFSSGENDQSVAYDRRFVEGKAVEDYDPAESVTGHSGEGPDRPDTIHHPPSWDAVTSGPGEVSAGNDPA